MCRKVEFLGRCTTCGKSCKWDYLTQNLSCLEAKNNLCFGLCRSGVELNQDPFDQDCDDCEMRRKRAAEFEANGGEGGGGSGGSDKRQRTG